MKYITFIVLNTWIVVIKTLGSILERLIDSFPSRLSLLRDVNNVLISLSYMLRIPSPPSVYTVCFLYLGTRNIINFSQQVYFSPLKCRFQALNDVLAQ